MQRIVVVEDDIRSAKVLCDLLNGEGYRVEIVATAEAALETLKHHESDLIISEVNLRGRSGLGLCAEVRRHTDTPFIFLSHLATVKDKVSGFRVGADDYIVKPYEPSEVVVRVWAALRRVKEYYSDTPNIRNNDLDLDPTGCTVVLLRDGRTVGLTTKECSLLHYLVSNPGRTLTREALLSRVWGSEADISHNPLDVYIARLRKKIEAEPGNPQLIITAHRIGYRFQQSEFPQSKRPLRQRKLENQS